MKVLAEDKINPEKPTRFSLSPKISKMSGRTSKSQVRLIPLPEITHPIRINDQLSPSATVLNIFCSQDFGYAGLVPDDNTREASSPFLQKVPEFVNNGKLKYTPMKKFNGGLEKVMSDESDSECIASGKGRAEKIVFTEDPIPSNLICQWSNVCTKYPFFRL